MSPQGGPQSSYLLSTDHEYVIYDLSGPAYDIEYGDPEERSWLKLRKERSDGKEEESRGTIKVVVEREGGGGRLERSEREGIVRIGITASSCI